MTSATSREAEERAMLVDCWRNRINKVLKVLKQDAWKEEELSITSMSYPWQQTDWWEMILGGFVHGFSGTSLPHANIFAFRDAVLPFHTCVYPTPSYPSSGQLLGDGLLGFARCISQLQLLFFSASLHTPNLHLLLQTHKCLSTDKFSTSSLLSYAALHLSLKGFLYCTSEAWRKELS